MILKLITSFSQNKLLELLLFDRWWFGRCQLAGCRVGGCLLELNLLLVLFHLLFQVVSEFFR